MEAEDKELGAMAWVLKMDDATIESGLVHDFDASLSGIGQELGAGAYSMRLEDVSSFFTSAVAWRDPSCVFIPFVPSQMTAKQPFLSMFELEKTLSNIKSVFSFH